jgi:nucleoid DNA-binding protein
VNASELVNKVAATTGLRQGDVRRVLDAALEEISIQLVSRDRVTLSGFGSFDVKTRAARKTHHPRTGDSIDVPGRDGIVFRPGTDLRAALRESASEGRLTS